MKYTQAREIVETALARLIPRTKHREASLIRRQGGTDDEIRAGITGKRSPAAKSGRALLRQAYKDADKKREAMPNYPYGKRGLREAILNGTNK